MLSFNFLYNGLLILKLNEILNSSSFFNFKINKLIILCR